MEVMRNAYKMSREPEWKRPLLRPGHRREDNIKGILKKGCEALDSIHVASSYRIVMNLQVLQEARRGGLPD